MHIFGVNNNCPAAHTAKSSTRRSRSNTATFHNPLLPQHRFHRRSPSSTIATNTVENVKQGGALFPSDDQDPFNTNNLPRSTPDSANAMGREEGGESDGNDNDHDDDSEEQHSKMWADLKNHWATPVGFAPPKLHTSHPSIPSKIRSASVASNGSSSYDSTTGKKKKKKKKRKDGEISTKAKRISARLYEHASSIKKRHEDRREVHQNAELEYCSSNQFSTSKKTKQMAGRRSMFMISRYDDAARRVRSEEMVAVSNPMFTLALLVAATHQSRCTQWRS